MFIEMNGEVFRVLKELEGGGCYVISTASPTSIIFIDMAAFERAERVVAPESFSNSGKADFTRYQLIEPLLEDEGCITDRGRLLEVAGRVAEAEGTTKKRILRIFHNYLGTGRTTLGRAAKHEQGRKPIFDAAIRKLLNDFGVELPHLNDDANLDDYLDGVREVVGALGWSIETSVTQLSLFSFMKINMYRDLERNADKIAVHHKPSIRV